MIFYFSGNPKGDEPERVLGEGVSIMITFWNDMVFNKHDFDKKTTFKREPRFELVCNARRAALAGKPRPDTRRKVRIMVGK